MNRWIWLLAMAAAAGCINGAPLPPTPASSLAVTNIRPNAELQNAEYVQMAQTYLRGLGKDPTQATYSVHRSRLHDDDETTDEPATAAIVSVRFFSGGVWQLTIKTDGDIMRTTNN